MECFKYMLASTGHTFVQASYVHGIDGRKKRFTIFVSRSSMVTIMVVSPMTVAVAMVLGLSMARHLTDDIAVVSGYKKCRKRLLL